MYENPGGSYGPCPTGSDVHGQGELPPWSFFADVPRTMINKFQRSSDRILADTYLKMDYFASIFPKIAKR